MNGYALGMFESFDRTDQIIMYKYNSWIQFKRKERREKYHVTAFANDVSSPWNFYTRKTILARNGLKDEMLTRFLIDI